MLFLPRMYGRLLPAVTRSLVDTIRVRGFRSPVWVRLVREDVARCLRNLDSLTYDERSLACELVDLYVARFGDEDFAFTNSSLYRSAAEFDKRITAALLDWHAQHVEELTVRQRSILCDIVENHVAEYGEFHNSWRVF